ncbi:MAG TPA: hypothetical protein VFV87_06185 [Pirellulaceae bacterium]|nr:hypothetical protein [Pirellulaceae bacterium]
MSRVLHWGCLLSLVLTAGLAQAADSPKGLDQVGKPDLKSAGPLAFGPKGVLFVGDPQGAAIFAIGVGDAAAAPLSGEFKLDNVQAKIAGLLGTEAADVLLNDIAVEPGTNIAYVSVSRGRGPSAEPAIIRVDGKGGLSALPLDKVQYAKVAVSGAPAADARDKKGSSLRSESITDLAFVDGRLFIAGLSNEEFASKLRAIEFPFKGSDTSTSVEIYHGAHGAFETRSPVRTFVPFNVGGEPHLLAAYTCTPLVSFPISDLRAGQKIRGTTVAELGNRNRPLDIISYEKDGKQYLLLANNARGVMKIATEGIEKQQGITEPIRGGGKAGLNYDTIADLTGVEQLDRLGDAHALLLVKTGDALNLEAVALP